MDLAKNFSNACYMPGIVLGAGCANLGMGAMVVTWECSSEEVTGKLRFEERVGVGQVKMEVAVQSPPNSMLTFRAWLHSLALLSSANLGIHCYAEFSS